MRISIEQPHTIVENWQLAFQLAKNSFEKIWPWALLASSIALIPLIFLLTTAFKQSVLLILLFIPAMILLILFSAFAQSGLVVCLNEFISPSQDISLPPKQYVLNRLSPLIITALCSMFLLLIGYVALILPGMYLTVVFTTFYPVILFEKYSGIINFFKRMFLLIRNNWWQVAITVGVPYLIYNILSSLTIYPLSIAVYFIFIIYILCLNMVLYHDLKLRSDLNTKSLAQVKNN